MHPSTLRAQNNSLPASFAISIFYEFPARVPPADSLAEYEANAAAGAMEMVHGQPRYVTRGVYTSLSCASEVLLCG